MYLGTQGTRVLVQHGSYLHMWSFGVSHSGAGIIKSNSDDGLYDASTAIIAGFPLSIEPMRVRPNGNLEVDWVDARDDPGGD